VLFSNTTGSGTVNNEDDFPTARLVDATTVRLARADTAGAPLDYSVQVVEFTGAAVDRGVATNQTGSPFDVISTTTISTGRTFSLFTARADVASNNNQFICKRRLKVRHQSNTTLRFRRGAGATGNCTDSGITELAWEKVQLPVCSAGSNCNTVQHPADVTLGNGTGNANSAGFNAIAQHRSVVLFAGQGAGGQAAGEGSYAEADAEVGDNTGALHGRPTFNSDTQVRIDRAVSVDSAVFAPQVVQFDP
jgi:hypothetical protein